MDKLKTLQNNSPSWQGVRTLYKKLSDEFHILTSAYGIEISPERKVMLDHLIIVIDEVDKCVDELPSEEQRNDITKALIDFLLNEKTHLVHPLANDALSLKIENLKAILTDEEIRTQFVNAAKDIFYFTEIKRHTADKSELIEFIKLEGNATANLPLSILGIPENHAFAKFFSKLCTLMGIADLVFDANSDYRKGYIVYKPGPGLYLTLNGILIKEGIQLLANFPRPFHFIWYCMKFTFALITEKELLNENA